MFCFNFRRKITKCVDEDCSIPEDVLEHIKECSACCDYYEKHALIADRLKREFQSDVPELPSELYERIRTTCENPAEYFSMAYEAGKDHGAFRRITSAAAVAAAAVLVAAACGWFLVLQGSATGEIPGDIQGMDDGSLIVAWLMTGDAVSPNTVVETMVTTIENPGNVDMDSVSKDGLYLVNSLEEYRKTKSKPGLD